MLPVLWNRSPLSPFDGGPISRLESLFERTFGEEGLLGQALRTVPVAVWEDEDHFYVEAELPGMSENDLDLTVQKGMLFIRGERRSPEGRTYLYDNRWYGRLERVVTLPEAIDTDHMEAKLTAGVLTVTFPKGPQAKAKKIAIKTS
ncbi:MAG: Hsp20/alpha crystallin family protein [Isosphaeraceae bacterium]